MKKKKTDSHKFNFEAFKKELSEGRKKPKINTREPLRYFLIVTEGKQTEPNYFRALVHDLPRNLVHIEIAGVGKDPLSIVKEAIKLRNIRTSQKTKPAYDEIWVVFDKDKFTAERFNRAIEKAANEKISPAYSNLMFELWFVLHFQMLDTAIVKGRYIEILKEKLGDYHKSNSSIYDLLQQKGDERQAIIRATKLLKKLSQGNPAKENPSTRVHELVKKLRKL